MSTTAVPRVRASGTGRTAALALSAAALLSFLARTFVDYRFVYAQLGFGERGFAAATLTHLAFVGGWIWALIAASHRRRAIYVLLGYDLILIAWAVFTLAVLCPSPCRTGWPVGEISIWSNLLFGSAAAVLAALALFRRHGGEPGGRA